jgi:hypothetical protein
VPSFLSHRACAGLLLTAAAFCAGMAWNFVPANAQQQPASKRPGGGGRNMPEALNLEDNTGFESIFDGSLKNWDGDPGHWRAEAGVLIGESTKEKPLTRNTFVIWRGGFPADFELKLEYRINSTNSGVQYRSVELPEAGQWVMKGYQADIDFQNTYTGQLYEERGRGFLALRGQSTLIEEGKKRVIANLRSSEELKSIINADGWNHLQIIARGSILVHILNGHLTSTVVDDDAKNRAMAGLIGFQLHMGPPMKVEFRNILLKKR